jgi:hypothetical protein
MKYFDNFLAFQLFIIDQKEKLERKEIQELPSLASIRIGNKDKNRPLNAEEFEFMIDLLLNPPLGQNIKKIDLRDNPLKEDHLDILLYKLKEGNNPNLTEILIDFEPEKRVIKNWRKTDRELYKDIRKLKKMFDEQIGEKLKATGIDSLINFANSTLFPEHITLNSVRKRMEARHSEGFFFPSKADVLNRIAIAKKDLEEKLKITKEKVAQNTIKEAIRALEEFPKVLNRNKALDKLDEYGQRVLKKQEQRDEERAHNKNRRQIKKIRALNKQNQGLFDQILEIAAKNKERVEAEGPKVVQQVTAAKASRSPEALEGEQFFNRLNDPKSASSLRSTLLGQGPRGQIVIELQKYLNVKKEELNKLKEQERAYKERYRKDPKIFGLSSKDIEKKIELGFEAIGKINQHPENVSLVLQQLREKDTEIIKNSESFFHRAALTMFKTKGRLSGIFDRYIKEFRPMAKAIQAAGIKTAAKAQEANAGGGAEILHSFKRDFSTKQGVADTPQAKPKGPEKPKGP